MGAVQPWHIVLVVIAFLVLFGAKKLPDAARGLGRSMRIFKSEIKEMQNDGATDAPTVTPPAELPARPAAAADAPKAAAEPADDVKRSA